MQWHESRYERERSPLELPPDELALSAYRVFQAVMGVPRRGFVGQDPGLDLLPDGERSGWERVGQQAENLLGGITGRPYWEAGRMVLTLWLGREDRQSVIAAWDGLPERERLAWEVVARHLTMVLNCDELQSLEQAEAHWAEWLKERLARKSLPQKG